MASREDKSKISAQAFEDFIKDLDKTAEQVTELINEIRGGKIELIKVKTELKFIVDNIDKLSEIVNGDPEKGSLLARVVILEKVVEELKSYISEDAIADAGIATRIEILEKNLTSIEKRIEELKQSAPQKEEVEGKWKLYITIAGGVFTLIGSIIALLMGIL